MSGNDQVSHIYGLGKKNLDKLFFDHTDYVCGLTDDFQGSLDELFQNMNENTDIQIKAVCSVVRLLACGYFSNTGRRFGNQQQLMNYFLNHLVVLHMKNIEVF